jgi:hypothetical protein
MFKIRIKKIKELLDFVSTLKSVDEGTITITFNSMSVSFFFTDNISLCCDCDFEMFADIDINNIDNIQCTLHDFLKRFPNSEQEMNTAVILFGPNWFKLYLYYAYNNKNIELENQVEKEMAKARKF